MSFIKQFYFYDYLMPSLSISAMSKNSGNRNSNYSSSQSTNTINNSLANSSWLEYGMYEFVRDCADFISVYTGMT